MSAEAAGRGALGSAAGESAYTDRLKKALARTEEGWGAEWPGLGLDPRGEAAGVLCPEEPPRVPAEAAASGPEEGPASRVQAPRAMGDLRERILSLCRGGEVADRVRGLRSQVLARLEPVGGRSLLVTSPGAQEGKSFAALHLAVSLAGELDRATVLVDGNLARSSLSPALGLEGAQGLSEWLQGGDGELPSALDTGIPCLWLLPAGRPVPGGSELLLGTSRIERLAEGLRAQWPEALLVFDGPGLSDGSGALALSRWADGVLLVAEAERTPYRAVRRAAEMLSGCRLLGAVLNRSRARERLG